MFFINETLRIVKKKADNQMPDSKKPYIVGNINGILIKKTRHAHENRDYEFHPRDYGLTNDDILTIFNKALKKPSFKKNIKTMIVYRNKKGKYDVIVAEWKGHFIDIITIMQKNKRSPYEYFTPKHGDEARTIVEHYNINIDDIIIIEKVYNV